MKRLFSILLCLFAVLNVNAKAADEIESIVNNGDLEDANVTPWRMIFKPGSNGDAVMKVDEDESFTGDFSLKVEFNNGGTHKRAVHIIQEPLPVKKGVKYTYSAIMKAEELRPAVMNTMMAGGGSISNPANKVFELTTDWNEYWFTLEATQDGNIRVEFEIGLSDVTMWIDHILFYEGEHIDERLIIPEAVKKTIDMFAICWGRIKKGA